MERLSSHTEYSSETENKTTERINPYSCLCNLGADLQKTNSWVKPILIIMRECQGDGNEGRSGRMLYWVTTESKLSREEGWKPTRRPEESEVSMRPWSRFQEFFQKCYRQTKHKMHILFFFPKQNHAVLCSALCFYTLNNIFPCLHILIYLILSTSCTVFHCMYFPGFMKLIGGHWGCFQH